MNWSSVKNLLIAMLIVANLFLLYNIAGQNRRQSYMDETEVRNAIQLLAERGLEIDSSGVPLRRFDADIYESMYSDNYFEMVSETLSGSKRESRNILPDGGMRIVSENGESFEFDGGFGFIYRKNNNNSAIAYTDITVENFGESLAIYGEIGRSRLTVLAKTAGEFLNSCRSEETRLGIRSVGGFYNEIEGNYYIHVTQLLNGIPVYGHDLVCVFNGDSLISANGRWYFDDIESSSYKSELYDQVNILFCDFDTLNRRYDALIEEDSSAYSLPGVTAVEACYVTYWNAQITELYFIPAWRIYHSDGTIIAYNAVNSTEYISGK